MGMALKVDVARACRQAGTEKPIDLVHLSNITMGDPALEREVLEMFLGHIPKYVEMLRSCHEAETACRAATM